MKTLEDIGDVMGKSVFVRVDWNVPYVNGIIADANRIESSLETIRLLLNLGAKVLLATHLDEKDGLDIKKLFDFVKEKYLHDLELASSFHPDHVEVAIRKSGSHIALLPNLRSDPREESNDIGFAKQIAGMANLYVNECFSVSHRVHSSVVGIPKLLPSYAGIQCTKEVKNLSLALRPAHPALFILGGLKYSTKAPLVSKFEKIYDRIFVGGAIAHVFFLAQGKEIGHSAYEKGVFAELELSHDRLIFTQDMIAVSESGRERITDPDHIRPDESALDAGPKTIELIAELVSSAKFVVWNGPLGDYTKGYDKATKAVGEIIAESDAFSVVGGGDTLAALPEETLKRFSFVSTGGGAMLDFLAHGTLPGIEALK